MSDRTFLTNPDVVIYPWQRALQQGDCFIYRSNSTELITWGEVIEIPAEDHLQNFRFCRVFSQSNPTGEEGYIHLAFIHGKIPTPIFWRARDDGWPADDDGLLQFALKVRSSILEG